MKLSDTENIKKVRKYFSRISIKKGFFSILIVLILAFTGFVIVQNKLKLGRSWEELILGYITYALPFLLIIWMFRRADHPMSSIFKRASNRVSQVVMVIPLITISTGVVWVVILLLNLISTETAKTYLNWINNTGAFNHIHEATILQQILFGGLIIVAAPVIEEIIFRGVMIERLGAKYSYSKAVVISSVIFGLLHSTPLGAFIFGVVLSFLYLKTQSLFVPILIHATNNALALFLMIANKNYALNYGTWGTVKPYISNSWAGIFLFTAGIIWLSWYIKQNWHNITDKEPFKLEAEKT
ncbi:type II CAAX endopeptidase family protein [Fodinibius halophilus]|uniref:CPBP family intramembrane metalloprotease n=1 Tax=Fodinibius halophilus TaxID=1736908 RepID=A0A6M1TDU4_9BACT|nr:type II CAAX endopeptidase family protein [Fodinibius halophilus]NGP90191.1 CPBP family intramembrane metalloprotease [Fodinibius halophilus]